MRYGIILSILAAIVIGQGIAMTAKSNENGIEFVGELPAYGLQAGGRIYSVTVGNHFCLVVDKPGDPAFIACP